MFTVEGDNPWISFICQNNVPLVPNNNENITFENFKEERVMINGTMFYNLTWTIKGLSEENKVSHQLPSFEIAVELSIRESDCTDISSFWVQNPLNVRLSADCPRGPGVKNGYIRRGTTAECGCEVYNNDPITSTVKWFTSDGQPVMLRNESVLDVTYNPDEKVQSYECRATSMMGVENRLQFVPKFYYPPNVSDFTVNKSNSITVIVGASVVFYCKVDGSPPAKALINGSGLGQVKEIQSNTSVLELVLEDLHCEDSGRYFCTGVNGFEGSETVDQNFVDVIVPCPSKVKYNSSEIPVVRLSSDKTIVFTFEIYGYPEPTKFGLKLESGNFSLDVNNNSYHISYISTVPPFGLVIVSLTNSSFKAITTYILTVANTEGKFEFRFIVIDQDKIIVQTDPQNVRLSADCPRGPGVKNGYIRRGTTAECGCEVYNNDPITSTVKWFTSDGQPVMLRNESVLNVTYNPNEKNQSYECRATSMIGVKTGLQFVPKFYYPPNVSNFTVNKSNSTIVSVGASVVFYCKVDGSPPAKALINGSGLGQVKEIQSNTSVLELVLEDLQCEDSGRYFFRGVNGFEDSGTLYQNFVDANVQCPPKVKNNSSEIPVVQVSRDKNTVFTLEIYGYPEPTKFGLKIESGMFSSDVDSNSYDISYISTVPPFGLVTVSLTDSSFKAITTYILTVANTEGKLELRFIVIDQDKIIVQTDDSTFWMQLGLGVGLSVLGLAVVVAVVIICIRRYKVNGQGRSEENMPHPDAFVSGESSTNQSTITLIDNWLFTNISDLPSSDQELITSHSNTHFIERPPDYFDD